MSHILFGSEGIRSLTGTFPLTIEALPRLGAAIAKWSIEKNKNNAYILIAHDTRASCHVIKAALKSGLLLYNTKLFDALALPTPAACLLTRTNKAFSWCIMITTSHNQYKYNGITIYDSQGSKISPADEQLITANFNTINLDSCSYDQLGNSYRALNPGEPYIDSLIGNFEPQFLKGKTILLDCAHGATSSLAHHIFRLFGAHVRTINDKPDGTNINGNCGILHPRALQEEILSNKVDAGIAFDGSGSRMIAINRHGKIKDGDDILALLSHHPAYRQAPAFVGTTFSNEGLANYLHIQGKKLIRTDANENSINQTLKSHHLPLGGDPSGHIIIPRYLDSSDGIFAALQLLETVQKIDNWDMNTFTHIPQAIINTPKELCQDPVSTAIQECNKILPESKFLVRHADTGPCSRILAEAPNRFKAAITNRKLAGKLHKDLENQWEDSWYTTY